MIDDFLKKVYIKVKVLFTQTENPLYDSFYKDEITGFDEFKKHALSDEVFKMVIEGNNLSEDRIDPMAIYITSQINRLYYMSKQ